LAPETLSTIIFEKGKHQNNKAIRCGCMDGLIGRMGACTRKAITHASGSETSHPVGNAQKTKLHLIIIHMVNSSLAQQT
jgi:hypothetical protein